MRESGGDRREGEGEEGAGTGGEARGLRAFDDGELIRKCATENNVTLFTSLDTVRVLLDVLEEITLTISTIDS